MLPCKVVNGPEVQWHPGKRTQRDIWICNAVPAISTTVCTCSCAKVTKKRIGLVSRPVKHWGSFRVADSNATFSSPRYGCESHCCVRRICEVWLCVRGRSLCVWLGFLSTACEYDSCVLMHTMEFSRLLSSASCAEMKLDTTRDVFVTAPFGRQYSV